MAIEMGRRATALAKLMFKFNVDIPKEPIVSVQTTENRGFTPDEVAERYEKILVYDCIYFYEVYTIHENVESFYLSFMKTSLGVKKSCTSDNIRVELGTYPMFAKIIPKALKFYTTMKGCSHNDLIQTSFVTSKLIHSCWEQGIHFFKPNWYEGALEW